jgi:alpha-galactosidase
MQDGKIKISFIGAGSFIFAGKIITDLATYPELADAELCLMDVDPQRLSVSENYARHINTQAKRHFTITATTDRRAALADAHFVLTMFEPDGLEARRMEVQVPIRHGVPQAVGDTLGPGGIFKGARTGTVMLSIARDMEQVCPNAMLLNYVNPMAINCWVVNTLTSIRCVGMCHGLAHTLTRLAYYLGLPDELETRAAGINHMCWLLTLTQHGHDIYPKLWGALDRIYDDDPVRFSLMKAFGYFMTESPYHMAEYVPYFTRRFAEIKVHDSESPTRNRSMCGWAGEIIEPTSGTGGAVESKIPLAWDIQLYDGIHRKTYERFLAQITSHAPIDAKLSEEYASRIIHSIVTDTPRRMSLNVRNCGEIANLSADCTVEVPTYVDRLGLHPETIGELPTPCAALCQRNVDVQKLVVAAIADQNPRSLYHAMLLDPLTGACLEPGQIHDLYIDLLRTLGERMPAGLRNA